MHHLVQLWRAKSKVPVCLGHGEQPRFGIIGGGECCLHHHYQLFVAVAQQSEQKCLFVREVFVDSWLAILDTFGHFASGDCLPPFLSSNLSCSQENTLPHLLSHLLPSPLSALLHSYSTSILSLIDIPIIYQKS